jgi:thiol-disulfide isomerase/thioredoxin
MDRRDWLIDLVVVVIAALGAVLYCAGDEPFKKTATAVVFSQEDCPPCLRMKKDFASTKLPVRFEERPEELRKNKVKSTPTTIIYLNGWPVLRLVGSITPQSLRELLAKYER